MICLIPCAAGPAWDWLSTPPMFEKQSQHKNNLHGRLSAISSIEGPQLLRSVLCTPWVDSMPSILVSFLKSIRIGTGSNMQKPWFKLTNWQLCYAIARMYIQSQSCFISKSMCGSMWESYDVYQTLFQFNTFRFLLPPHSCLHLFMLAFRSVSFVSWLVCLCLASAWEQARDSHISSGDELEDYLKKRAEWPDVYGIWTIINYWLLSIDELGYDD